MCTTNNKRNILYERLVSKISICIFNVHLENLVLSSMQLLSRTEGFIRSPILEQALRQLVPTFTATQLEHLIPNHVSKSPVRPFRMNTTANLGPLRAEDLGRVIWERCGITNLTVKPFVGELKFAIAKFRRLKWNQGTQNHWGY